jgi:hypothetical protein
MFIIRRALGSIPAAITLSKTKLNKESLSLTTITRKQTKSKLPKRGIFNKSQMMDDGQFYCGVFMEMDMEVTLFVKK